MSNAPLNKISGMPQMTRAFGGWQSQITMAKRCQIVLNGLVRNEDTQFSFKGTVQPLTDRAIALKPEGQRAFTWLQVHCFSGPIAVTTNDRVVYNARVFKVMAIRDYTLNGFIEYHLVEDFQERSR